jgi:hypothetical protein
MKIKLPARTLLCRWFGWSDRPRWTNTKELLPEWDERTRILAGLLPINSRVIDSGLGEGNWNSISRSAVLILRRTW